jgi:sulfide dehydrogenase cytochrome subunit
MMRSHSLAVLAVCSLLAAPAIADDDFTGRSIGSACFGCHGAAGANRTSIPPIIHGVPAEYIESAMKAFRDGSRPATIMGRIAKGYTDEEITAMANYISSQGGN